MKLFNKISSFQVIAAICMLFWGVVILYPFYNSVLTSIVPMSIYVRSPFLLYPPELDFSSYKFIFQWGSLITGFKSTLIIVVLGVAYNLFLTVSMSYVLSKPIPGRRIVNLFVVFTMFFQGGLIPGYLLIKNMHLIDSYGAMFLPMGITVMNLMIMRSYFQTIPVELDEAARLDGAGEINILTKIYLPLSLPMLATIGLFYGVDRWNEWYNGMLFIRTVDKLPLQLVVRNMMQSASTVINDMPESLRPSVFPHGIQMAGIIVTILPISLVYPFLQKYFVKGLTLGGVKA
ncbi:MAG: carbohydrate ABC transporter permease [Gorillibacterium sp.]|nr:carbohydrate ABC transporter permease [Gorillibacterium sp.]